MGIWKLELDILHWAKFTPGVSIRVANSNTKIQAETKIDKTIYSDLQHYRDVTAAFVPGPLLD